MADNKKVVLKNTFFLYFRMMITMVVSLYTSRVILQTLGINDYGIYQAVGGIVGMVSFLNSALSVGSSRFITFALGEGKNKIKSVFGTTLFLHIGMATVIILLAETGGLFFLYNYMNLPEDRMNIFFWVYQLSILAAIISIVQIPYSATIIAHERMGIYAYMSIFDVVMKLAILYLLTIGKVDKLLLYAFLVVCVQSICFFIYRYYCSQKFKEIEFTWKWDKNAFRQIGSFSTWSLMSNISAALNNQGMLILLNIFFVPSIVAARAISIQVNMAINQFVENFRTAVIPQIVKSYAQEKYEESKRWVLTSTCISFYLILIIGLPLLINSDWILNLWLKEIPDYTSVFVKLILLQSFIQTIDNSLYYGLYACGKIRENSFVSPIIGILGFLICYLLFKMGYSPVSLSWCYIIIFSILAFIIKPILLIKLANYSAKNIFFIFQKIAIIGFVAIIVYILSSICRPYFEDISFFVTSCILSFFSLIFAVYFFGLEYNLRNQLKEMVKKKLSNLNRR